MSDQTNGQLNQDISNAQEESNRIFSRPQVVEIIRSVMQTLESDNSTAHLYDQLDALAGYIEEARQEIAAINPDEISDTHIAGASDELDAIVNATAEATGTIMDCCEEIELVASDVGGENGDKLVNTVTKVYEACSFQDITGQRITKVITALKHIELKVVEILEAIGEDNQSERKEKLQAEVGEKTDTSSDQSMLNGPSTPAQGGVDQDEIDRLLADFD